MSDTKRNALNVDRRFVVAGASLAAATLTAPGAARAEDGPAKVGPLSDIPIDPPQIEFIYEARVELDQGFLKLGMGPLGERTLVPITGGKFAGPKIRGTILNGGADRQLARADGGLLLNALYEMRTDDGAILTVNNRALVTKTANGSPYAFSQIDIIAPDGPHAWLNHFVFVGNFHFDPAEPKVVLIRAFSLT